MIYVFDNYTLDTDLYILHRAEEPVKLEHQVFKVLTYLIEHCDYVVAKQELFEHLWPDRFVSDKALERCIQMARRALGDQRGAPRFIQTLRGPAIVLSGTYNAAPRPPTTPQSRQQTV